MKLVEILEENNIELISSTNNRQVARCMFHNGDNTPSFTVYPNETYYCFGCRVWGDSVKFLVEYKGMTDAEAREYVGEDYKLPKEDKNKVIKVRNVSRTWPFLYGVASAYHAFLCQTPGAINYLQSRGLTRDTIDHNLIGFTDGHVLQFQFADEYRLGQDVGLLSRNGYEALSHRITIPNLITDREVDFITGRTVTNDKVKYLGLRVPKPLFGFHSVSKSPILFMVEGQFDFLTLRQWGYPAISISGSSLKGPDRLLLKNKQLLIVPDNDDVGLKSAASVQKSLPGTEILDYKSYGTKDINSFAVEVPGAEEIFKDLILETILPWLTFLSRETLTKWFPTLVNTLYSPLT